MLKIIIADDESHVRELITKCINNVNADMQVVGEAENGDEALELIEKYKPDILLTDVCMPDTNGLELLERLKAANYLEDLKTIIISGYDDFEYAQKAIKLGVNNYLLKPFSPEELFETLDNIKNEIKRRQAMIMNISEMTEKFENNLSVLQESFLQRLISDNAEFIQKKERAAELKMDLDFNSYFIGLVKIKGSFLNGTLDKKKKESVEKAFLIIKDFYFNDNIITYAVRLENNVIAILFGSRSYNKIKFYTSVKGGIERINKSLNKYYGLSLLCAIGSMQENIYNISKSYKEALSALQAVASEAVVFAEYKEWSKLKKNDSDKYKAAKELQNELIINIRLGNQEKSVKILRDIMKVYEEKEVIQANDIGIILLELTFMIEKVLEEALVSISVWDEVVFHDYVKKQLMYGSILEIECFLTDLIKKACMEFESYNENKSYRVVEKMKMLIEHNLGNEEFTLEMLGNELYFSPNYLRKIFKQIVGEAFTDYLIKQRMETAAGKLNDPTKKIQDVSIECGYSNQRYFASAFKKYYGITPTQYREGQDRNGKEWERL